MAYLFAVLKINFIKKIIISPRISSGGFAIKNKIDFGFLLVYSENKFDLNYYYS